MARYVPPVLAAKAESIEFSSTQNWSYHILFRMPNANDAQRWRNEGHAQIIIRNQANNSPAVNPTVSPDRQVLYVNGNSGFVTEENGIWSIRIPYNWFFNGDINAPRYHPVRDNTYTVQVRFGDNRIWEGNLANFTAWRQSQVMTNPSRFGEWSNVQTVYCHAPVDLQLGFNFNDFLPELDVRYSTQFNNPIE
jgi:hypothetical protein